MIRVTGFRTWHAHLKNRLNSTKPNRPRMSKHTRIVLEQGYVLRTTGTHTKPLLCTLRQIFSKMRISHLPPDVRVPTTIWSKQFFRSYLSRNGSNSWCLSTPYFQRISTCQTIGLSRWSTHGSRPMPTSSTKNGHRTATAFVTQFQLQELRYFRSDWPSWSATRPTPPLLRMCRWKSQVAGVVVSHFVI